VAGFFQRAPKTEAENAQIAQARDTRQRTQEARREGRPPRITAVMLSPEQRKQLQKMRAEKASQSTTNQEKTMQRTNPSVEQRITNQRQQRSDRARELARLKEQAQKGLEASKQQQARGSEQTQRQQNELQRQQQRNMMDQQRQQTQRGIQL